MPGMMTCREVGLQGVLVHEHSMVLARLWPSGCQPTDLLPSLLAVQCAACSALAALRCAPAHQPPLQCLPCSHLETCAAALSLYQACAVITSTLHYHVPEPRNNATQPATPAHVCRCNGMGQC